MKTIKYPKTYAKIIDIQTNYIYDDPGKYWVFETDDGQIITARNPGSSGHTPNRLYRKSREIYAGLSQNQRKKNLNLNWTLTYIGERVKLYTKTGRPPGENPKDRIYYRWLGQ